MFWVKRKLWVARLYSQAVWHRVNGKCPRRGDSVRWCGNGDNSIKMVAHVYITRDEIEYADGTSDSYHHCAWEKVP